MFSNTKKTNLIKNSEKKFSKCILAPDFNLNINGTIKYAVAFRKCKAFEEMTLDKKCMFSFYETESDAIDSINEFEMDNSIRLTESLYLKNNEVELLVAHAIQKTNTRLINQEPNIKDLLKTLSIFIFDYIENEYNVSKETLSDDMSIFNFIMDIRDWVYENRYRTLAFILENDDPMEGDYLSVMDNKKQVEDNI